MLDGHAVVTNATMQLLRNLSVIKISNGDFVAKWVRQNDMNLLLGVVQGDFSTMGFV